MLRCRGLKLERLTQSNQRYEKEDRGGWEGCENSVESSIVYLNCWGKLRDFSIKNQMNKKRLWICFPKENFGEAFLNLCNTSNSITVQITVFSSKEDEA